jgi:hypothetical protein
MKIRIVTFNTPTKTYQAATNESKNEIIVGWLNIIGNTSGKNLGFKTDNGVSVIIPASICLQTIIEIEEHDGEFIGIITGIFNEKEK